MTEITIPRTIKVDEEQFERAVAKALEDHPDFVMVVRCEDCKWRNTEGCIYPSANRADYDYCSDGERKKDDA